MLVNPSVSESFNPFSITELRFALNYLIDRNLIVNELIGGYGNAMISNYGIFSADYLSIIEELESFHFKYNPALADEIISHELEEVGAEKIDGYWYYDGEQIEITFFIRSDDPVRKSIGGILSSELENIGFKVNKDFGDLNKAFVVVYGSNPADQKWHFTLRDGAALDLQSMIQSGLRKCTPHGFQTCQVTMIQHTGITKMITLLL